MWDVRFHCHTPHLVQQVPNKFFETKKSVFENTGRYPKALPVDICEVRKVRRREVEVCNITHCASWPGRLGCVLKLLPRPACL